jgi:hypothetical protein
VLWSWSWRQEASSEDARQGSLEQLGDLEGRSKGPGGEHVDLSLAVLNGGGKSEQIQIDTIGKPS